MASLTIIAEYDTPVAAPVWVDVPAGAKLPPGPLEARADGLSLPVQREGERLAVLAPPMKTGERRRFKIEKAGARPGVSLREEGAGVLAIVLPEGPFTSYHYGADVPRPFFYPVLAPGGKSVTRSYPMKDVAGEMKDHPHHRSFWTAYGEVNGVDDWSEVNNEKSRHGFIRHQRFLSRQEGPVFGGLEAANVWTSAEGRPLLDERRLIRVYNAGPAVRLLDYDVILTAAHGDVHYGDTKEGGILAFRVATSMDGNKNGLMENSLGGKTEKEVWGKRAQWLDYSGPVEGETLGIAMMDHPGNLSHPCYWHARDYGLVGTNPFARASFEKGLPNSGYLQKAGETLHFRYRVFIHRGGAKQAAVNDVYHAWIQAPQGRISG